MTSILTSLFHRLASLSSTRFGKRLTSSAVLHRCLSPLNKPPVALAECLLDKCSHGKHSGLLEDSVQGLRAICGHVNTRWVDENFSFEELQTLIYDLSGYNRNRYELEIMARVLQRGRYVRIALGDDVALRDLINKTVRSGDSGFEVFACRIQRGPGSGGSGQNFIAGNYQRN